MPKTFVKAASHVSYDIPTSSATSLIKIPRVFKIMFSTASMFSAVVDVLRTRHEIEIFSSCLKQVIP